jgi:hypothetical protein
MKCVQDFVFCLHLSQHPASMAQRRETLAVTPVHVGAGIDEGP